jgi:hypothetical protein
MQDQGIAGLPGASVPSGSVSGLGVCDVWRLELSAVQWPWLADELDELRGPLEEELQRARVAHDVDPDDNTADELSAREYELRLLRAMRAQLPACDYRGAVMFVGPAQLVRGLVAGSLCNAVGALSELAGAPRRLSDRKARGRLAATADAARSWAQTFVDCQELEDFSFEPPGDPLRLR